VFALGFTLWNTEWWAKIIYLVKIIFIGCDFDIRVPHFGNGTSRVFKEWWPPPNFFEIPRTKGGGAFPKLDSAYPPSPKTKKN